MGAHIAVQRYGLPSLALSRRASSSVAQVVAFGLGMLALMLLTLVRGELLDEWKGALPDDAPNFFLINIQPDEVNDVRNYLEKKVYSCRRFTRSSRPNFVGKRRTTRR